MRLSEECCEIALHAFVATTAAINATIGDESLVCAPRLGDLQLS